MPRLSLPDRSATLAFDTAGERGPRIVLVQGAACIGEGWRPQIDELARDHRVAWLDNRGIGGSVPLQGPVSVEAMAGDCVALLDHLGWERAHLVGHSLGGLVVQQAARAAPGRVQSLCLMSTLRRGRDAAIPTPANLWISLRAMIGDERSRWLTLARMPFPRAYLASVGEEEALRLVRMIFCRDFLRTPPIVREQVAALWRHVGGDMAPLRTIPTLIVTGDSDIVVRTELSDELRAHLPAARLERIAGAGHGVPLQCAAEVNVLLREHVAAAEG